MRSWFCSTLTWIDDKVWKYWRAAMDPEATQHTCRESSFCMRISLERKYTRFSPLRPHLRHKAALGDYKASFRSPTAKGTSSFLLRLARGKENILSKKASAQQDY